MGENPIYELIEKFNKSSDVNNLITICNLYNLCFNYEKNTTDVINKIILRLKKNITNAPPLLYYHCNGLVIDTIRWKVLSVPPVAFNKKANIETIDVSKYDVIKVIDGTVVTLYYDKKWCISSCNGYDVSQYYWMGTLTYAEIIYDLIERLHPEIIDKLGISLSNSDTIYFDKLDQSYSYTIGFRHHNFHPLIKDPEVIWNIQHVNLRTLEVFYDNGLDGIKNQEIINDFKMKDITTTTQSELHYGYILRTKNANKYPSILLDTPLLRKIKKNIYTYPSNTIRQYITHENRYDYVIIKNYFNKFERNEILQLYPQFAEKYKLYSKCINDTIRCMLLMLKNKLSNDNKPINVHPAIHILANSLIKHIAKFEEMDPYNENTESVLKDYIMNVEYSVLFLHTINKKYTI
jgi:hypothetical protein